MTTGELNLGWRALDIIRVAIHTEAILQDDCQRFKAFLSWVKSPADWVICDYGVNEEG
jgi:hypothetical protein